MSEITFGRFCMECAPRVLRWLPCRDHSPYVDASTCQHPRVSKIIHENAADECTATFCHTCGHVSVDKCRELTKARKAYLPKPKG